MAMRELWHETMTQSSTDWATIQVAPARTTWRRLCGCLPCCVVMICLVVGLVGANPARTETARRYLVTAFHPQSGHSTVQVADAHGRVLRTVAGAVGKADPRSVQQPDIARWSPDRTLLAWAQPDGLVVERADGTSRHFLVRTRACSTACLTFAWSPDSKQLLVAGDVTSSRGVAIVSLVTGPLRQIAPATPCLSYRAIGWSRGNGSISYVRSYGSSYKNKKSCSNETSLLVGDPRGKRTRTLFEIANPVRDSLGASWSPDGKHIAFTTDAHDPADPACAIVNAATGAITPIPACGKAGPPVWSPDSTRVAIAQADAPVLVASVDGAKIGSFGPVAAHIYAWTSDGIYLSSQAPHQLLVSRDGKHAPRPIFTLPRGLTEFVDPG